MSVRLNPASRTKGVRRRLSWLAALAVLLSFAVGVYGAKKPKVSNAADQQKRALHALDRLTFGPRPGDVHAVPPWASISGSTCNCIPKESTTAQCRRGWPHYRTLQMSSARDVLEFPPNPVVKAVMDGKLPMPSDPIGTPSTRLRSTAFEAESRSRSRDRQCGRRRTLRRCPRRASCQPKAAADAHRTGRTGAKRANVVDD